MNFKEIEYNLSDGSFNFELKDIYKHVVMTAGGVFALGHELVNVSVEVNESMGYAYVSGFKVVDARGNDVSYFYKPAIFKVNSVDHLGGGVATTHIFDSPCDTQCNIDGCEYTRAVAHSGDLSGEGNCNKAYICENCGCAYMPEKVKHISDKTVIYRCGNDLTLHEVVYVCCGSVAYKEEHYSKNGATCKTLAVCDGCGRTYGELDPNNHEQHPTYVKLNADNHSVFYPCCSMSYDEKHSGGKANCSELATCEHCGTGYGVLDPNNHSGTPEIKANPEHPELHIESYKCCGKSKAEAHSGGKATCLSPASCEVCGVSYGKPDSHNHASEAMSYQVEKNNASMHEAYHVCCNGYAGKFIIMAVLQPAFRVQFVRNAVLNTVT